MNGYGVALDTPAKPSHLDAQYDIVCETLDRTNDAIQRVQNMSMMLDGPFPTQSQVVKQDTEKPLGKLGRTSQKLNECLERLGVLHQELSRLQDAL